MAADRELLFGLLALQNGLIEQEQLVAAFRAWSRDRSRGLADHLAARGDLDAEDRLAVERLVERHLRRHGGSAEQSLASLPVGRSTRDEIAAVADADLNATLAHTATAATDADGDPDRTTAYGIGQTTAEGQRFRMLRPHARGGLGTVYVALDGELHREVALKEILDQHADDPVSRQRFLLEAEITGGLEHPGIVPVYGLGSHPDGRPFYAMRFIRGDSLKEAIERFHGDAAMQADAGRRSLELRKLLRRFLDVCNAIQYAHSRGVLHRDIKPGNIIVGRHGETLVVDWGLAKARGKGAELEPSEERPLQPSASASGSADTLPGAAIGTPVYMSPEQARGDLDSLGPRSDVYSLGATLYSLLTGKSPFEGDVGEVIRKVQQGQFPPPRQRDPRIDRALEAICLKAMATRAEQRYPSARGLADDVERWIADEPVSAFRDPLTTRLTRWGRRHRTAAASIGALLATAVAALSVGSVLIQRERARAEAGFQQARAAVDEYFTTVSESKLLNVPGLQPLRKELLDAARRYYEGFLKDQGANPGLRAEAAQAAFRVGWVTQAIDAPVKALEPYRTAAALAEQLARDEPGNLEHARLAALAQGAQGMALAGLGRHEESLARHREALRIRQQILDGHPSDIQARIDVARTHRNLGDVLRAFDRPAEALAELDQAIAIARPLRDLDLPRDPGKVDLTGRTNLSAIVREDLASALLDKATVLRESGRKADCRAPWDEARALFEALVQDEPGDLALRTRLADCYAQGSFIEYDLGRIPEAEQLLRRVIAIRETLAAENASVPGYRRALAEDLGTLAFDLRLLGRRDEALATYTRAADLAEALAKAEPTFTLNRNLLGQSLAGRANLLLDAGKVDEAAPLARRAVEVFEQVVRDEPERVFNTSSLTGALRALGRTEAALGDPAAALQAYRRAAEVDGSLAGRYPMCRYNQACDLALLVPLVPPEERDAQSARAIQALRQAIDAGYRNFANIAADNDLDALRDRADFQSLVKRPGQSAQASTPAGSK